MGEDYVLSRNEVTFDIGANDGNTITIIVDVLSDALVEGTEDVVLSGSVDAPASFVGGPVTFNIVDDDCKCILVATMDLISLAMLITGKMWRCISPVTRQKY